MRCLDRDVVCKCAFASIHGISTRRVESVLHRSRSATTLPLDKRGKHKNRPNRTDDETNSNIDEHIQSFPAKSSHYSRNDNHNKKYLSEDLSVAKMHRLYLEAFEPDVAAELCLGGDSKPAVKYEYYLNRFNTHHNLSFGRPRSDTCPTCDMIELKMKEESDASTKARLEAEKQLHLRKAERFYTSMQEHSALAARDPTVATLAFDFEQNLPVPVLPVGDLFYARQLWLYTFGSTPLVSMTVEPIQVLCTVGMRQLPSEVRMRYPPVSFTTSTTRFQMKLRHCTFTQTVVEAKTKTTPSYISSTLS